MLGRTSVHRDYSYNLVLFKEINRFIKYRKILGEAAVWLNLFGNVAAFIPFGGFVPIVIKKEAGLWQIIFITAVFSLIIECVQLVLRVGSFDVDDILLNTIGGFIGAVIFFVYRKLSKSIK